MNKMQKLRERLREFQTPFSKKENILSISFWWQKLEVILTSLADRIS